MEELDEIRETCDMGENDDVEIAYDYLDGDGDKTGTFQDMTENQTIVKGSYSLEWNKDNISFNIVFPIDMGDEKIFLIFQETLEDVLKIRHHKLEERESGL